MKFYRYHQNNSGGYLYTSEEDGISATVWVEARNYRIANALFAIISEEYCSCCSCCGDRWDDADESDGVEAPEFEDWYDWERERYGDKVPSAAVVHYLDGRIEWLRPVSP